MLEGIIMKVKIILGLILTMSLSCTSLPVYALKSNGVSPAPIQNIVNNKINFEVVADKDAPKDLLAMISKSKENKGFIFTIDDATGYIYIAVLSGTKRTGGHSIEVTGIDDNEGKTNVFVKEIAPSKDLFLTQVITYPYTIVKAKGITPNITVINTQEQYFKDLTNDILASNIWDKDWKDLKGFTNVVENKEWTIKFNRSIENIMLTSNTVYILDSFGKKVSASLSVSSDMKCVTVKPIKNYEFDQTYYLFISKNIYGEKVSKYNLEGYRMMFTTRAGVTVE
jgi:hypothetical protein